MPEPRRWLIMVCEHGKHVIWRMDIGWLHQGTTEYCVGERRSVEVVEAHHGGEPSEKAVLVLRDAIREVLDEWGDFKAADHPTIAAMAAKAAFRVGRSADHAVALRAITALSPRSREEAADAFEEAREIGNAALAVDAVSGKEGENG